MDQEEAERVGFEKLRGMADLFVQRAARYWGWGDGFGGAVFALLAGRAAAAGLPIDKRGAAVGIEMTEAYDAASIRLTHLRRDVLLLVERDGLICHYCHRRLDTNTLQVDHVVPRAQGGSNDLSNLVLACPKCNGSKGGRTPEQWRSA